MKKKHVSIVMVVMFLVAFSFHNARAEGWEQSYHAGTFDKNRNYMGGTELMFLTSHKGKLYAATSLWMDVIPLAFSNGAQVLVKESAGDAWKLDYQTGRNIKRVDNLASITFGTDGNGNKLSQPVNLLVAGLGYYNYYFPLTIAATVAVRDDATNKWFTTDLITPDKPQYEVTVRAIGTHKDKTTGVDRVFAGAYPGGIFSGVYDAAASGQIRWDSTPEFSGVNYVDEHDIPISDFRVMSFGECNGELYAAIKPAIFKRVDGPTPTWVRVFEYTTFEDYSPAGANSLMRALTAIANPKGDGEVLLMTYQGVGAKIVYLDPSDNNTITTDLDLREFLKEQWGADWEMCQKNNNDNIVAAFNDMVPVTDQKTGEDLLLMGIFSPCKPDAAWYLIRHPDSSYTLHEIPYIFNLHGWPKRLQGTRTIRISPFAEDNDQVLYFGGFNVGTKSGHNTAWIYSVDIDTALGISQNQ